MSEAINWKESPPFTCFQCGDGQTPLFCLNCAREGYTKIDREAEARAIIERAVNAWAADDRADMEWFDRARKWLKEEE